LNQDLIGKTSKPLTLKRSQSSGCGGKGPSIRFREPLIQHQVL